MFVPFGGPKSLSGHSVNVLIIPILRDCITITFTGLSLPVMVTDRSCVVLRLWFILIVFVRPLPVCL